MCLVQDPDHGTSVMGVMKMRNIVSREGIELTSLEFPSLSTNAQSKHYAAILFRYSNQVVVLTAHHCLVLNTAP